MCRLFGKYCLVDTHCHQFSHFKHKQLKIASNLCWAAFPHLRYSVWRRTLGLSWQVSSPLSPSIPNFTAQLFCFAVFFGIRSRMRLVTSSFWVPGIWMKRWFSLFGSGINNSCSFSESSDPKSSFNSSSLSLPFSFTSTFQLIPKENVGFCFRSIILAALSNSCTVSLLHCESNKPSIFLQCKSGD